MFSKCLVIILFLTLCIKEDNAEENFVRPFPCGFLFGASTSAYQIEGAWNEDGKGENIWDRFTHKSRPCIVYNCSNGDIADDSYHQIKRDVQIMRELGLDYYRFSISWARILPTSFPDYQNELGIQYYNSLIDEMLKYNIQPMVTLYHFELPQKLQDMGGWTNSQIVDWFADYARVAFTLFGDRVKYWITVNEPLQICLYGYGIDYIAPALNITGIAEYLCGHHILLAHAKAYHIYDQEFREQQGGSIFITISARFITSDTENNADAAQDTNEFEWGWYIHPIFSKNGDYPAVMKKRIAAKSKEQGFPRSRLPEFTLEQIRHLKGSSDYFGLNHYSTCIAYRNESIIGHFAVPSFGDDLGTISYQPREWESTASPHMKVVPWGFYKILTKLREEYNNPTIFVTENGYGSSTGLDDDQRVSYHRKYLSAMLDAIDEGSNVIAYTAWSMMDNFEWTFGYSVRFGLYEVDYETPERTRTPRKSAFVYKEIIRSRALDMNYVPDSTG